MPAAVEVELAPGVHGPLPPSVLGWMKPHVRTLGWGYAFLLLTQALEKSVPWTFGAGLNELRAGNSHGALRHAGLLLVLAALGWWVRTKSRVLLFNTGRDVEFAVRNAIIRRLHKLGPLQELEVGEWMSRATNDVTQVRLLVGFGALNLLNSVVGFTLSIALMFSIHPQLAMYALIPFPFLILVTGFYSSRTYKESMRVQEQLAALTSRVHSDLGAARIIRSLGAEDRIESRFDVQNQDAVRASARLTTLRSTMFPVLLGLVATALVITVHVGSGFIATGELSLGSMATFLGYLGQLSWPTLAFGFLLSVIERGRSAYNRIHALLVQPSPLDAPAPEAPPPVPGAKLLSAHNLRFDRGGQSLIQDLSFELERGEFLAVIGPTGSGKSTLAALLAMRIEPTSGTISLEGIERSKIGFRGYRKHVLLSEQTAFLFGTSVRENVIFSAPKTLTDDDAERAADLAAAREEIENMPDGWNTEVGSKGVQLSGGQRQRVALARAFASPADLLILDDPLSAVDTLTESRILTSLHALKHAGKSVILVTHRIRAAEQCDRILLLSQNAKAVLGTAHELKDNAWYKRTKELQLLVGDAHV